MKYASRMEPGGLNKSGWTARPKTRKSLRLKAGQKPLAAAAASRRPGRKNRKIIIKGGGRLSA